MSLTREDATLTAAIVLWVRENRTLPRQCTVTGGENKRLTISGSVTGNKVNAVVDPENVKVSSDDFGSTQIEATFESYSDKVRIDVSGDRFVVQNLSSGERHEGHFENSKKKIAFEGSYVVQYELY